MSADNLCKQFGSRSGPTLSQAWSGSKLLDTLMVFLKNFFEKVNFEKKMCMTKTCKIKLEETKHYCSSLSYSYHFICIWFFPILFLFLYGCSSLPPPPPTSPNMQRNSIWKVVLNQTNEGLNPWSANCIKSRLLFSSAEMFKKPLWQTVWTQIRLLL